MRVAVLEDDADHAALLTQALQGGGHGVAVYPTAARLLQALARETFDVLVLDWMLPDMSGLDVLQRLRALEQRAPVLFVTSRDAEADIVQALSHGADDYLVKPPRPGELLARVQALARRASGASPDAVFTMGRYAFDPSRAQVRLQDEVLALTQRQFALALVLFRNPGRLLSRQYLLETVWGLNATVQTRTLDIHVSQLRTALRLSDNGWRIHSIYAHGYRLETLG